MQWRRRKTKEGKNRQRMRWRRRKRKEGFGWRNPSPRAAPPTFFFVQEHGRLHSMPVAGYGPHWRRRWWPLLGSHHEGDLVFDQFELVHVRVGYNDEKTDHLPMTSFWGSLKPLPACTHRWKGDGDVLPFRRTIQQRDGTILLVECL